MANLVSPGVEINVIDETFFVPGAPTSAPLIFIATQSEKTQPNSNQPALGTFEFGVVRTVTSQTQAQQLYGNPVFLTDANGNPLHGDSRNESGLDALFKALEVNNLCYVVRANVNLADSYATTSTLFTEHIQTDGDTLLNLVTTFIQQFNQANNLVPADPTYKTTVTQSELTTLVSTALSDTLSLFSFSSAQFSNDFIQDHTVEYAGYQDAVYSNTSGFITTADATGLNNDTTLYGFQLHLVSISGSANYNIQIMGNQAQTFGALVAILQTKIDQQSFSNSTVQLIQGRIRITSDVTGATSAVQILSDGYSGVNPLFANTNLFQSFATSVPGQGIHTLNVYNSTFTTIIGGYSGLDGIINNWNSGSVISNEFTPQEAEGVLLNAGSTFVFTKEFMSDTSLGANDAARRAVIVKQLNAIISNTALTGVLANKYAYNVVVTPGYWECTAPMEAQIVQPLNSEVFCIGDTPVDMPATGPNSIVEWASSPSKVVSPDVAYYWPHGLSQNIDGAVIMTTAASTALRVFLFSDQQAAVWYAAAGVSRGTCPDLTQVGYVSGTLGTATTFVIDYVDEGEQGVLYATGIAINPIPFISGRGILVMGNKTTQSLGTQLDFINASRLVKYIKRQLRQSLFAFLFEPDDSITWNAVQSLCNSFLGTLIGRRALFDFASTCDTTTNTPATIDAHELIIAIALQIIPDVEFIIANITLVNAGVDLSSGSASSSSASA